MKHPIGLWGILLVVLVSAGCKSKPDTKATTTETGAKTMTMQITTIANQGATTCVLA